MVSSGIAAPSGWEALPELATAVGNAARADGVVVEGAEAWGETGFPCWTDLRSSSPLAAQAFYATALGHQHVPLPEAGRRGPRGPLRGPSSPYWRSGYNLARGQTHWS